MSKKKPLNKKRSPRKEQVATDTGKTENSTDFRFDKRDIILSLLVFTIILFVYILTLAPSVYSGDSGEFVTAAYHLGIVHPPGYPLYCLLGKLFMTLAFVGDMAFRMNLMSAFFAAAASAVLYLCARIILTTRLISVSSAFLAAFSLTLWSQAVVTEVYTLAAFFFALILFFTLYWLKTKRKPYLFYLAATAGLALTHHITIAAFYPIIALFIILSKTSLLKDWKTILKITVLLLLPMLLYLYLPLRSSADPPTDWGNPETLTATFKHMTAQQYRGKLLEQGWEGFKFQISKFYKSAVHQFTPPILTLILLGFIAGFKLHPRISLLLATLALMNLLYSALYFIVDIETYFIPTFLIFAVFIGFALEALRRLILLSQSKISKAIAVSLLVAVTALPLISNWHKNDRSKNQIAKNYGLNILKTIEQTGVFFSHGDNESFILAYLKLVENRRPDISIYDRTQNILPYPNFKSPKGDTLLTKLDILEFERIMINETDRPIYFNAKLNPEVFTVLCGLLYKVYRATEIVKDEDPWSDYDLSGIDDPSIADDFMTKIIVTQYHIMKARYLNKKGEKKQAESHIKQTLSLADDVPESLVLAAFFYSDLNQDEKAEELLFKALDLNPFCFDCYQGLGSIEFRREKWHSALEYFNRAIELKDGDMEAHNNRGLVYEKLGDSAENANAKQHYYNLAMEDFDLARSLAPENSNKEFNMIRISEKSEPIRKVKNIYQEKLQNEPENANLRYQYGVYLAKKGLYKLAIEQFKTTLTIDGRFLPAMVDLGGAYLKLRKEELALVQFKQVLKLDPTNDKAKRGIEMIETAVKKGKAKLKRLSTNDTKK